MFPGILHRSILGELVKVFFLALVVIMGLNLMAGLVAQASQFGLSPSQILVVIALLIPSTLPYTLPATTLFATCMVYGRLAHDNEITAVKAAGINVLTVAKPGLVLGLAASAVTMGLYYHLIPHTHHLLRTQVASDVEDVLYGWLKRDRCIKLPRLSYGIWVKQVHGRRLNTAIFKHFDAAGKTDYFARAHEAELHVDLDEKVVVVHMRHGTVMYENGTDSGYFKERDWRVPLPDMNLSAADKLTPRAMSWRELFTNRVVQVEKLAQEKANAAALRARLGTVLSPEQKKLLNDLEYLQHDARIRIRGIDAEVQMRPALCLGCLCFVLVGCPVGIWFSKSDYLSAFITCFLPIVFLYYPLMLCGTNMAKEGKIHPVAAVWAANAVLALIGLGMFRRLLRH